MNEQDSSAIHVIPRVRVVQSHAFCFRAQDSAPEWTRVVFLLKVSNPTLGNVRLRFSESSYSGEVDYWNNGEKSSDSPFFSRLLVDSLSRTIVHAAFRPNLVDSMARSETVDLLSAEDSIIELGGKALRTPAQVLNWSPDNSVDAKDAVGYAPKDAPSMRLIATNAADAWFELSIRDTSSYSVLTTCTVPLALEVDLGNGSWESSLIPVTENVASDKAVFDIVLAWTLN